MSSHCCERRAGDAGDSLLRARMREIRGGLISVRGGTMHQRLESGETVKLERVRERCARGWAMGTSTCEPSRKLSAHSIRQRDSESRVSIFPSRSVKRQIIFKNIPSNNDNNHWRSFGAIKENLLEHCYCHWSRGWLRSRTVAFYFYFKFCFLLSYSFDFSSHTIRWS